MNFISAKEAAANWGLTKRRVLNLCKEGRIPGAQLVDTMWIIPSDAAKPADARSNKNPESNLLKGEVTAKAHSPQYKMHKYFARRPYNVFQNIIKTYTQPDDVILDCFCGGGVTIFEGASMDRHPIGIDINPLATFITEMQMFNGNVDLLEENYLDFLAELKKEFKDWYYVKFSDDEGYAIWTEWIYEVECPDCHQLIHLSEENKISNGIYKCPNESCSNHVTGVKRVNCRPVDERISRIKYRSSRTGQVQVREAAIDNFPLLEEMLTQAQKNPPVYQPDFPIPDNWDRLYEDKLREKGVVTYKDFFTTRNYMVNCFVFDKIMSFRGKSESLFTDYLYFLFSSSLRYTNKMARVSDNWENGNPTCMDKHAFWLPNVFVENNIIDVIGQRIKAVIKGCQYASTHLPSNMVKMDSFHDLKLKNGYMLLTQSATHMPIPDHSVDAVITDPPYGSNVQYAELSTIWNAWYELYKNLGNHIFKDEEAVVNRKSNFTGHKDVQDYESLLRDIFTECYRVLKDDGTLVFTFNNKNIKIWIAMLSAVTKAGFYLPADGIVFQDYIDSYKNTAHLKYKGNITGDFIYSFKKRLDNQPKDNRDYSILDVVNNSLNETIENMFYDDGAKISNGTLYQDALTRISRAIMQLLSESDESKLDLNELKKISNQFIDDHFKAVLSFSDGYWERKQR